MNAPMPTRFAPSVALERVERIRVRGAVQGVGFRPTVWRLAREHGLSGWVCNDGQGVVILVGGDGPAIDAFATALLHRSPPLSRIETIERETSNEALAPGEFRIVASAGGKVRTAVVPDAATCPACLAEINDPSARRYRYPFTNCTHCGPRLSIIEAIPYDRASTTMRDFSLCPECAAEYGDPADRRFHAQPVACRVCGPRVWLEHADGRPASAESARAEDDIEFAAILLERGHIVAIKGIGGFQLACDASNESAVTRLRERKQRERKPFALMVRDPNVIRRYCQPNATELDLLQSPAAPIVILDADGETDLASGIAPGVGTLGFMLPNTPLHHLLLKNVDRPIVLTSGNLSDEPQCTDNDDARKRLGTIADFFLMHDRGVARRVDDSVARLIAGEPRLLRRARGYAPASIRLPSGFEAAPPLLAMGAELKSTFALLHDGEVLLSHHMGDLDDARCHADYVRSIAAYQQLFEHEARLVALDNHPDYLSSKLGRRIAEQRGVECLPVQHHHAHIAACLADNGVALDSGPVFGVALDGLGFGADGTLWGGEFFLADYRQCQRLACIKAVALPGGSQAIHEPWRNTYAQLAAGLGWEQFIAQYRELDFSCFLAQKPLALLQSMIDRGINSPLASSCGRLFDAVAVASGLCRERAFYEGQAAVEFEALIDRSALNGEDDSLAYPFALVASGADGVLNIDPTPMWRALLEDLSRQTPIGLLSARFHKGLSIAITKLLEMLKERNPVDRSVSTVALSGGVFQNRVLLEQLIMRLEQSRFRVLTHHQIPANDGGIALGQAAVAAARAIVKTKE